MTRLNVQRAPSGTTACCTRTKVLPFDAAAAKLYGVLAAVVRQAGRDPRPRRMDLQVAATAAANGLPLLTRNADDLAGLERLVTVLAI